VRTTSPATQAAWLDGDYVGDNRPMIRATIQRLHVCLRSYGKQTYASVPFGQNSKPLELPNLKDVKWNRSIDGGVASCTLTLYNTEPLPVGQPPEGDGDFDEPGYYTYQRGKAFYSPRWDHQANGWQDWIVPDRIIRTYEGYGFDASVAPERDPHLYISGTWLIDDVTFGTDGLITVACRDIGRVLLDQILFPPVVPFTYYPLYFDSFKQVDNPDIHVTTGGWIQPAYDSNSNEPYVGSNSVHGHYGRHAFDTRNSTYWLSVGNGVPDADYSFEWIQGRFSSRTVSAVEFKPWGGPYRCYVSVFANGKWQGDQTVPYNPDNPVSAPNHSDVRYLYSFHVNAETTTTYKFKKPVSGATKVRLTFTHLTNSGMGQFKYRAGVRSFKVSGEVTTTKDGGTHTEPKTSPPGYGDYTDIVKMLLAWAGFYWPAEPEAGFVRYSDGSKVAMPAPDHDPILTGVPDDAVGGLYGTFNHIGRVWGDFENTGTSGPAGLGVDIWDKKPIMDGINYVRDIVGFIFYVDETGGAVFRSPNIWSVGNYVGDGGPKAGRTTDVVVIDEKQTLMNLSTTLSSRSIREKIFVGNISGHIAAMAKGHNPYPSGLRRIGGWTDQHFLTTKECQIMADLITLRQLFTYRTDKVTIPGNPAIQIDDQVRIYERVTEEGYLHYVSEISMTWSLETGKYTYDLSTHWLGDTTFSNWTFNPDDLSDEAQAYLRSIGKIS
jgi:hypothetical protein